MISQFSQLVANVRGDIKVRFDSGHPITSNTNEETIVGIPQHDQHCNSVGTRETVNSFSVLIPAYVYATAGISLHK